LSSTPVEMKKMSSKVDPVRSSSTLRAENQMLEPMDSRS
jgi:hypothetical protein